LGVSPEGHRPLTTEGVASPTGVPYDEGACASNPEYPHDEWLAPASPSPHTTEGSHQRVGVWCERRTQ
jgi:hypothetical protein